MHLASIQITSLALADMQRQTTIQTTHFFGLLETVNVPTRARGDHANCTESSLCLLRETLRPAKRTYNVTVDLDYNENWK